jgi:hypothetical protein
MTEIEILQAAFKGELLKTHNRKGRHYSVNGASINKKRIMDLIRRKYLSDDDKILSCYVGIEPDGWIAWNRWHEGIR